MGAGQDCGALVEPIEAEECDAARVDYGRLRSEGVVAAVGAEDNLAGCAIAARGERAGHTLPESPKGGAEVGTARQCLRAVGSDGEPSLLGLEGRRGRARGLRRRVEELVVDRPPALEVLDAIEQLGIDHDASPTSGHVTASIGMSVYDASSACWVPPSGRDGVGVLPECDDQDLFRSAQGALKAAQRAGCAQSWWADVGRDDAQARAQEVSPHSRPAPLQAMA